MIAVLVDRKGFTKAQEIPYPILDIRIAQYDGPRFYPEPDDRNVFDRLRPMATEVVFGRSKELYPNVWLYEEAR